MRSLRARLVLSHILPLLIVIPIIGVTLLYIFGTQVLLTERSNQLELQAYLIADLASENPFIWYDPLQARAFVGKVATRLSARVMLLSPEGYLLATNDANYSDQLGQVLDVPGLQETVLSKQALQISGGEADVGGTEVLMPVVGPTWQVIGVIRLFDPLSSVYDRFPQTRTLITWVLVGGLAVGVLVGTILASDLARPLRRATQAILQMADGEPLSSLPQQGPKEMRLLVQAFNTLTTQLQTLEKSRKRLLANLVHELGRPLGALLSATQALSAGAVEKLDLRQDLLRGMEGEVQRMQHLLDDLTRMYDQSLGPLELKVVPTTLAPWLTQVLSPWREAAQEKGLGWSMEIPETLPTLTIDTDRMAQAVGNVVSNAVKYTPPDGEISVQAGAEADKVWIRVRDTGVGIPPEEQTRIFEPFYRGPSSRRFPQGMGLGLSIARDLVAAHHGTIHLESKIGSGSTFTIWLPRESESPLQS